MPKVSNKKERGAAARKRKSGASHPSGLEDCSPPVIPPVALAHTVGKPGPSGLEDCRPLLMTPVASPHAAGEAGASELEEREAKTKCRSHHRSLSLEEDEISRVPYDSGSDDDDEDYVPLEPEEIEDVQLRRDNVYDRLEWMEESERRSVDEVDALDDVNGDVDEELSEGVNISNVFDWSEDFSTFSGQKETYQREPGPTFAASDPVEIFLQFWDLKIMETIVTETNRYAAQCLAQTCDLNISPKKRSHTVPWSDTSVAEMYRYFAQLIFMSFCYRTTLSEYWITGTLEMPDFKFEMTRNRFLLITKYLHFVNNENLGCETGHARKVEKVRSILDHCNRVFSTLYTPAQYLSLDESLLLWKGRLSWRQCIRTKRARFGIKIFELCEADTGYLLRSQLYTGKDYTMHPEPIHGFSNMTAKCVLHLMDGFLDAGHVLVMDNWYNELTLTRYLKSRQTDVLGTMSRARRNVPQVMKYLEPTRMARGEVVARQCGDIALVSWKDVKLVTLLSTYHSHEMVSGNRAKPDGLKPKAVVEYNQYMGGVDLKDQKLSNFLIERKRGRKWYMKVFKRLFNTSLLNAFIIYSRNPLHRMYTHREFRYRVAEGLMDRFPRELPPPKVTNAVQTSILVRLQPGNHFPVNTAPASGAGSQHRKFQALACVRCKALKKRTRVNTQCDLCKVPLCIGKCWKDYHSVFNLSLIGRKKYKKRMSMKLLSECNVNM